MNQSRFTEGNPWDSWNIFFLKRELIDWKYITSPMAGCTVQQKPWKNPHLPLSRQANGCSKNTKKRRSKFLKVAKGFSKICSGIFVNDPPHMSLIGNLQRLTAGINLKPDDNASHQFLCPTREEKHWIKIWMEWKRRDYSRDEGPLTYTMRQWDLKRTIKAPPAGQFKFVSDSCTLNS